MAIDTLETYTAIKQSITDAKELAAKTASTLDLALAALPGVAKCKATFELGNARLMVQADTTASTPRAVIYAWDAELDVRGIYFDLPAGVDEALSYFLNVGARSTP